MFNTVVSRIILGFILLINGCHESAPRADHSVLCSLRRLGRYAQTTAPSILAHAHKG